jgi:hypothetical protein
VFIFSGADGTLLSTLALPSPQAEANVGPSRAEGPVLLFDAPCVERTKYVQRGKWRTLEDCWNCRAVAFFITPSGAQIKMRYGVGWLGWDSQKQTLDGINTKTLSVGGGSGLYARMQMKVSYNTYVPYTYCPTGPPEERNR